jgi:hypothetical protein
MCRRQEAHRLLKPSTADRPEPTVEFGLGPRSPERRCTNWHAVPGASDLCASRTQRILRLDCGWRFGWGIAAPDSQVIRWSLAGHVVGVLGGGGAIVALVGCADVRRRIGCSSQAPPTGPNPPGNLALGPGPSPQKRRCMNWHAVPGVSNRCASRTQRILRLDRGWGFGCGIAAPDSRVIRWSLAGHVVGVFGGEDAVVAIVGCADARRRIGRSNQAPTRSPNPPRNLALGLSPGPRSDGA